MLDTFHTWLREANMQSASDIHLSVGQAPVFRIHGELFEQTDTKLESNQLKKLARTLLDDNQWQQLEAQREFDFSYSLAAESRFRMNVFYQRGTIAFAIRLIPVRIRSIEELQLPKITQTIMNERQGLILVTGATGSGKSTTLAAMIDHLNRTTKKHIITLEDPIEYMHTSKRSFIDQREVGSDTMNFSRGLRASLRQDPDVILVGELRDLETIETAITAAETGHLVLGTLHTSGAISTIERIIDVFPVGQQNQIRMQLASVLSLVVSQQLLSVKRGAGRVAATEILVNTTAVKNLIRTEKVHHIQNVIQTSKSEGMHTLEMEVRKLLELDQISYDIARPFIEGGEKHDFSI